MAAWLESVGHGRSFAERAARHGIVFGEHVAYWIMRGIVAGRTRRW